MVDSYADERRDGGMHTTNSNEAVAEQDWTNKIAELTKDETKFLYMAGKGKTLPSKSSKFNWIEYEEAPPFVITAGCTVGDITTKGQQINLTTNADVLNGIVEDTVLFLDADGGKYFLVTEPPISKPNEKSFRVQMFNKSAGMLSRYANELSTSLITQTITDAMNSIGKMYILHTSKKEAFEAYHPVQRFIETTENRITTFSDECSISKHDAATAWRPNVSKREWQQIKMMKKHAWDIERSLMFAQGYHQKGFDAHGKADNRDIGNGLLGFPGFEILPIPRNQFDYLALSDYCRTHVKAYNQGKDSMTAWVNGAMLQAILEMSLKMENNKIALMSNVEKNSYGLNIRKLVTPHIDLELITNPILNERYGDTPAMIVCDMDKISIRYLASGGESFATKLEEGIQSKSANYYVDRVVSAYGLQVENLKCHTGLIVTPAVTSVTVPEEPGDGGNEPLD